MIMESNNKNNQRTQVDEEGKLLAVLCYIPFLCFIPLFKPNIGTFANQHLKQGLILLVVEIIALFFLIDIFSKIFWTIIFIFCLAIACVGIATALSGKEFKVPVIGSYLEKYDL